MFNTRRAAGALACAAAIGLSACDADQVGAAAVVDGDRISVGELQDEVRAFHELAGTEPAADERELQRLYLRSEINHRIIERAGDEAGVSVSEAEIDQFIDETFIAPNPEGDLNDVMVQERLTEQGLRDAIRDTIMIDEIVAGMDGDQAAASELFDSVLAEMEIEVNPRYGEWDGRTLQEVSGSISEPATP